MQKVYASRLSQPRVTEFTNVEGDSNCPLLHMLHLHEIFHERHINSIMLSHRHIYVMAVIAIMAIKSKWD